MARPLLPEVSELGGGRRDRDRLGRRIERVRPLVAPRTGSPGEASCPHVMAGGCCIGASPCVFLQQDPTERGVGAAHEPSEAGASRLVGKLAQWHERCNHSAAERQTHCTKRVAVSGLACSGKPSADLPLLRSRYTQVPLKSSENPPVSQ